MMTALIGRVFSQARAAVASLLVRMHVSPNALTVLGLVPMAFAAWFLAQGRLGLTVTFIIVSSAFDILDGAVAKRSDRMTPFGAVLDSSLDRYADILVFGALAWRFAVGLGRTEMAVAALAALTGALLVSYTRARAECLIERCRVGFWARGERLIYLMIGMVTGSLVAVTWLLAVGTHGTALGRILYTRRMCATPPRPIEPRDHATRILYWDYERGTTPYDIAVAILIAVAIAAPRLGWR